ncbi:MAG: type VI secretion system-associated protein TagO [Haemophilus parainfluenzae]|jgi:type VI secretion-associated protein, VC_A0118 family|nr:type VI secretion system-associated protein TagO [[Eubacterium] sulci]MBS6669318.1 type VI secretion system-associated protein TagO [Haemophilus parainfluenzae]
MRFSLKILSIPLFLTAFSNISYADLKKQDQSSDILLKMEQCRSHKSELERLDCYDKAWGDNRVFSQVRSVQGGKAWNRAIEQEKTRTTDSLNFLTKITESEDNPTVVITTPSLGHKSPRPVLMISCVDNITRLQIAMPSPINERDVYLDVITNKTSFKTHWFFRENGFLLEASRGLEGISEIQRLFKSSTLRFNSDIPAINELVFKIEDLENEIKPLKTACHW